MNWMIQRSICDTYTPQPPSARVHALLFQCQLLEASKFIAQCPKTQFILNHGHCLASLFVASCSIPRYCTNSVLLTQPRFSWISSARRFRRVVIQALCPAFPSWTTALTYVCDTYQAFWDGGTVSAAERGRQNGGVWSIRRFAFFAGRDHTICVRMHRTVRRR